jgi:hypothetical protein
MPAHISIQAHSIHYIIPCPYIHPSTFYTLYHPIEELSLFLIILCIYIYPSNNSHNLHLHLDFTRRNYFILTQTRQDQKTWLHNNTYWPIQISLANSLFQPTLRIYNNKITITTTTSIPSHHTT